MRTFIQGPRENRILGIILLLGLVHGLLYLFLVPPWQHYDEPTHFEYAWLIANRPSLPQAGDYDQGMRREVAASMIEHGFFKDLSFRPNLLSENEPVWIGISELRHPPLYYWLVALPLRLLHFTDITFQLYVSRLVSLFLYLASILAAWGVMAELVPPNHPLRWMVPISMALLPGLTDLMTAVNNDVGATAVFSLFLWGCMRLLRQGFSAWVLLWTAVAAALGIWTKSTVSIGPPILVVALLFSLLRGARRWLAWALLLVGSVVGLFMIFAWGDAAFWYRSTIQPVPTRASTLQAPVGSHSFQLEILPNSPLVPAIYQFLPLDQVLALRDKTVTFGAWIWATQPMSGRTPILRIDNGSQVFFRDITLANRPNFHAVSATIPDKATRISISLELGSDAADTDGTVFYNGVVLAEGAHPTEEAPQFGDSQGSGGIWGGQPFHNLLRNATAENSWPWVRPWADTWGAKLLFDQPSMILASLIDWPGAGWYYWAAGQRLFRSFWATFDWGGAFLLGSKPYFILGIFTTMSGLGVALGLRRKWNVLAWDASFFLAAAMMGVWGPVAVRGVGQSLTGDIYIPVARYGYPAVIPTLLLLNLGWLEILRYVERRLRLPREAQFALYLILFLGLDGWALFSLVSYFGR